MANQYSTTNFVTDVKTRAFLPTTSVGVTTTQILSLASDELKMYVTAFMMRAREEYNVTTQDTLTVANQTAYDLPIRASGNKLKMVQTNEGASGGANFRTLPRIEPERVPRYSTSGSLVGYFLQEDQLVLLPAPASGGNTLRFFYFMRPGELVDYAQVGEVQSFNAGAKTVTLTTTPPSLFTSSSLYDIIKGTPGFRYRRLAGPGFSSDPNSTAPAIDQPVTSIVGNVLTFTNALPTDLAVGDIVCLQYQSGIPQVPVELQTFLAQRTAFKVLEALGDPKAQVAKAVADQMEKDALTMIAPRTEGQNRYVINPYGPGWRRNRYRR